MKKGVDYQANAFFCDLNLLSDSECVLQLLYPMVVSRHFLFRPAKLDAKCALIPLSAKVLDLNRVRFQAGEILQSFFV